MARKSGAPKEEIEVTPEMIEAGLDALFRVATSDWSLPSHAEIRPVVREIYLAMRRSSPTGQMPS